MNKIYRIIWNSALNAWVVVSELTRNHTKRASATAAVAVLATLLSATAQASTGGAGGSTVPDTKFDPKNPSFTDDYHPEDDESSNTNYKFGLVVVGKNGTTKTNFGRTDDDQGKVTISVEDSQGSTARPKYKSSYLYLREDGGIEINQEGRSAKFKVKAGDGLKIDTKTDNLVADTVALTVTNGKVTAPTTEEDKKKLVNADGLTTALNELGWQLKTTNGTTAVGNGTTVKSGDEVEFKGEDGVTVTSSTTNGKHTVTIRSTQTQGANKGGSWKITADKEDGGELDPANTAPTEQEVKTGEKVTLKAGDNLKIKQNGKDFTYSLKKELKDLTSVEFKDANGGTGSASTKIDKNGLTITPANGGAAGTGTSNANTISVTTSGISAGNKEITNVKSGLTKYNDNNNDAKKDLVDLSSLTNTATVGATNNGLANKAATVGDLAGLGWVLSSDKTTDDNANKQFHAAVKNATEVEFVGKNGATVSAKTGADGKHTVTVDVATVEAGNGLEKDTTTGNTIKLKVKSKAGEENLLTVGNDGVSVTKGEFNTVETTTPAGQGASANNRGKVTVKASANGTPNDADNKKVATVGDVAKAINDAATFVKVESTTDDIEDGTANGNTADDQALKAGDTLTFKAGKNLKAKLDKTGKSVTFALAKSIETDSATLSEKLSIGKDPNKVDIISDTNGLKLSKGTNGDTAVHLNGLASTLPDVTTNTGSSTSVTFSPSEIEKTRAATLKDVLNAGWNIKGAKVAGGNTENVDLVAGYDNVEFITGDKNTLDVVLTAKENGKATEVKFTPKISVIKEKDGKLLTGKQLKDANTGAAANPTEDADEGNGLVTAKAVIDAVNKSGWRVSGEGTTAENGATAVNAGTAETVTSGTSVNFKNGNATTATVSKVTENGETKINVKYDVNTGDGLKVDNQKITVDTGDGLKIGDDKKITVNTGDGLKLDNQKIVADTTTLTVTDGKVTAPDATNGNGKKLVNAGDLVNALNKLSWKAKADKDTDGEAEGGTDQEVKAGETVTFKAGKNLKVKQSGKDFTYSLKDELTGLTSIALGTAGNGKTTTKITENGLTVSTTPANGGTATEVKIGSDGISAGNKAITNVASGLKTYGDNQANAAGQAGNPVATAKNGLIDLSQPNAGAAGTGTSVADTTAATVGDLRKLGWVLSADKTTNDTGTDTAFHAAVKNATEVEFKGTGAATVSAKTENGKHTVTIDVAETKIEASDGIEKTNDGKLKLKVKTGNDNLLTVGTAGASVAKGKLEVVSTTANSDKKGQVKAKSANGTDATDKDVATVKDVADAINKAETFVKVENTTDDIEDAAANGADNAEEALKAGDTLTFKAGKNLKAKLDKTGKSVTFALAKSIETDSATLSKTLSIGENGNKVNITSDTKGLNFAKETAGTNGDTTVHLNGIGSTLHDTLSNTGVTTNLNGNVTDDEKKRAASVRDVLNVGWNIKGVKSNSATKQSENVDFVRTYDTVEFLSGSEETTTVTVDSEDNGKTTKVKIGAKTSVIAAKDGKLVTGKDNKANGGTNASEADNTDEGNGLVTAKAVIDAVNKAGWRIKTTAANGQAGQAGDNFETVTSGTNVTFADGNVTKATVSKNAQSGAITVKYDVNVGDGWKIDDTSKKIVADTTALTVNSGNEADKPKGKVADVADDSKNKLVKAGDLVTALNSLSWTATAGKDGTGEVEPTTLTEQEVKAGDKVTFKAGDNLKVKQSGKDFTYSLKKDLKDLTSVEFKDANGGTNGASTKITKDGLTITPANGANGAAATDADKIKVASDGISAGNKAVKNVVSGLKKFNPANPIVGKDLDNITKNADDAYKGLTNLDEKDVDKQTLAVADNTAATVGDLRGLGWVISADKTTGGSKEYHDQVRNANEVKFKSGNGISVSGKTVNGRREITFELAKGEVVKSNEFTAPDGTNLVKVGDKYYSKEDIDPTTGKPMTGKTEKYKVENGKVVSADGNKTEVTLTNKGSGYVTGNQVADAIAKSGFELGLANEADAKAAFDDKTKALSDTKAETVNANDKVRFADGKHTKVSAATVESIDANGEKVTTTFVKTDVELPLTQIYNTDANGKKITKVVANGQTKWYELKDNGSTDMDKEVTLGNVDSDGKKVVKDNDKWYHAKADGTADTSTQAVDNSKVSTDEKHVVSLDPNNQSNGKGVVIDNVANGDISPNSKQAVNGSQIFALTGNKTPNITSITVDKDGKTVNVGTAGNANDTNKTYHNVVVGEDGKTPLLTTYNVEGRKEVITNSVVEAIYNMNEQGIKFFHSNDGKATSRIERSNEIDSSASGKFATAIGAKADAAGENAIAFGYGSKALRDNTVAIGTGNVVNAEKSGAFGDPNYIEDGASGSYAFGNDNRITSKNTFVLGNSVNAKRDANGNVLTEEKEIIGKDGNKTTEKVPQALGKTVENSVYLGNASTATENPGSNLKSDGTAGNTTTAGATGTVNGFAGATAHGAVSVGASGEERRIQNVAAGEISATSTDAINGSQLYAATKGIADQAVGMVRALKRELEGVAAGANAAAALPQSYLPGKSMISAATGAYGSTGALAVGYSSISDNGKWVVKGQLNINTRSKAGGGVGVGYIW
ncbi:Hia/Hsf adhesin N-terminal domain-containing protein [Neisseria bergeri]|uniref:Hia/Hsf adhesin N-terminal domain-containing protein n=1 Tax=Neisseria bergeri TaxID=1906581 RepID=UPI00272DA97A|nr:Hia/Hsf adhesin N-terminal domain-containing protein [Neisseria bergeri]